MSRADAGWASVGPELPFAAVRWLLPLLVFLCACEAREVVPLTEHEAWALADDQDPWPAHRPDPVECSGLSWSVEDTGGQESLEVDTQECNYLVVAQDSVAEVRAGDTLRFRLWHFDLFSFDSAEAHAAITVDGVPVFEELVPIPGDSEMLITEVPIDEDIAAGVPVVFHLHNHGSNVWNLIELSVYPPGTLEE